MCKVGKYRLEIDKEYIPHLIKEGTYKIESEAIDSPKKAAEILNKKCRLNRAGEEFVYLISLNTQLRPIAIFGVGQGGISQSYVEIRGIMERALLSHSSGIILSHNHPSGSKSPSKEDYNITNRLKKACDLMGIKLEDHIIIAGVDGGYYSFRENGDLN